MRFVFVCLIIFHFNYGEILTMKTKKRSTLRRINVILFFKLILCLNELQEHKCFKLFGNILICKFEFYIF